MATRPTLPYFAPAELLPAPLPTVAEIEAGTRISSRYQTPVYRVGDHFAVKFGGRTSLQEGENMLFVKQSTGIPIPQVYAIFHDETTELDYIVMEYVPGRNLKNAWGTLDATEQRAIALQLRKHMDELRSIPSPGYYGGIWRQPIRDFNFLDQLQQPHTEPNIAGPHETEEQWVEAMYHVLVKMLVSVQEGDLAHFRRHYHAVLKGHKPVFTHGNLLSVNIILQDDGTAVIIDWENSGWYPSFWEYCCTIMQLRNGNDWGDLVYDILDMYAPELGLVSHHRDMVRFGCSAP
jgi:tRNA A-37 threonylcarbamoyl transferase component Bud32